MAQKLKLCNKEIFLSTISFPPAVSRHCHPLKAIIFRLTHTAFAPSACVFSSPPGYLIHHAIAGAAQKLLKLIPSPCVLVVVGREASGAATVEGATFGDP